MSEAIKIWEPRYHDRKCLVASFRIPKDKEIQVEIMKGSYKGLYSIAKEAISESKQEFMKTKAGKFLEMRAIPLEKLERIV